MSEISGKCPVVFALDVMGDRWSMVILRDMMFRRKRTFSQFLESHEKISTNILADRLEKLESARLISTVPVREGSPRNAYEITPKGADLLPVMLEMIAWSAKYDSYPAGVELVAGGPEGLLDRIKSDRDGVIVEVLEG